MKRYQITFYSRRDMVRKTYLNGSSFETREFCEAEIQRIRNQETKLLKSGVIPFRSRIFWKIKEVEVNPKNFKKI